MNIGIITNPSSVGVADVLSSLECSLRRYNVAILKESEIDMADVVIVLGGDGTMLLAAHIVSRRETPIIGFNMGRLGFITSFSKDNIDATIDELMKNTLHISSRLRLECELWRNGKIVFTESVLNDFVIAKSYRKIVDFSMRMNNGFSMKYRADGYIVATPTGSTGHSLSAGGPIVDPEAEAILLTAICPHTVSDRDMVVSPTSVIEIELSEPQNDVRIMPDGGNGAEFLYGDRLLIRRSPFDTQIYSNPKTTFYEQIQIKFGWGPIKC